MTDERLDRLDALDQEASTVVVQRSDWEYLLDAVRERDELREAALKIPDPAMEQFGDIDWKSWALFVRDAAHRETGT